MIPRVTNLGMISAVYGSHIRTMSVTRHSGMEEQQQL